VKLLVLLCGEEDEQLIKAALGTLAVLSSLEADLEYIQDLNLDASERQRLDELVEQNRIICNKIVNVRTNEKHAPFTSSHLGQILHRYLQAAMRVYE
jgi:hypothetical protein